ncbi:MULTISPECIES: helix-turn-helix transcriptional regulator [Pantoea]|jgi:putative transcriptional regulator|uniref:helix-turn-helix transcriptional regulator n=1 Tax=Pantoea TaxID=53335 RepID=UPI000EA0CD7C|nr:MULTISPECIES: helix-turn-helix transcriptional regulator [Pantoea]MBZ6387416.1 helix-turn-helix transcriptional regulator [Pantoea piersonii]MBZ6402194.1 helix-turn-helix transcriptional regulator [Pantoea piersonii]MBZ6410466.1 helix-turn-helix transcriptional regulator [Pantoea piersonii]MBZ6429078.1 helix-turn-helix transcriptional regulator [Pantoea piersonii]NYB04497.1 helix-turn-helix transcriptional regulator [Pantoea piersonii]
MCHLRKIRKKINVSQALLAQKIGCSQGAIGHYENKRRKPDLETCRMLVRALKEFGAQVELDDVFPPEPHTAPAVHSYQYCP